MATLIIYRAQPFKRGDQSINIFLNGQAADNLFNNDKLELELPKGQHTLRAFSDSFRGKPHQLTISGDEIVRLQVRPYVQKKIWLDIILLIVITGLPGRSLFGQNGFYVKTGLYVLLLAGVFIISRSQARKLPRIEPAGKEMAADAQVAAA